MAMRGSSLVSRASLASMSIDWQKSLQCGSIGPWISTLTPGATMDMKTSQLEALKKRNLVKIYQELASARPLSRPEIARRTHLSTTAVSGLADELSRMGLVEQAGFAGSKGGRPAALLKLNPGARFSLGAYLADQNWIIVATDLAARVVERVDVSTDGRSPEAAVTSLCSGVEAILGLVDRDLVLPAIGLGTPGLVDTRSGVIKTAVDMGWSEVPIAEMVEAELGRKVFVVNRSKVGALAELALGAGRGVSDLIYVSIGTGIAAGIVHERRLHLGANSSAGELGHLTVLPDGPPCPCGNRGCLQQLASGPAIAAMARARIRAGGNGLLQAWAGAYPEKLTAGDVFEAATQNDSLALDIVHEVALNLGLAVANIVNLLNPELVVLGGPVGRSAQVLIPPLEAAVRQRAMAYPLAALRIVTSTLGPDAGAIGAASLVLQEVGALLFGTASSRTTVPLRQG